MTINPTAPAETAFSALNSSDPYPIYARLRDRAPIQRTTLPNGQHGWAVMGYEEAQAVLKDQRFGKDVRRRQGTGKAMRLLLQRRPFRTLSQGIIRLDPPDHTRLRALVVKAFTPRRVERLAPRIQQIADELLDAVAGRGRMDLIAEYASPLAVAVIAELLGIPAADRPRLVAWSVANRFKSVGLGLLIFAGSIGSFYLLPSSFLPQEDTGRQLLAIELPPGSRLEDTRNVTEAVAARIRERPEVRSVFVNGGNLLGSGAEAAISKAVAPMLTALLPQG